LHNVFKTQSRQDEGNLLFWWLIITTGWVKTFNSEEGNEASSLDTNYEWSVRRIVRIRMLKTVSEIINDESLDECSKSY